jgi:hypothetical protein
VLGTIQTYGGTALGMSEKVSKLRISTLHYLISRFLFTARHDATILFVYYSLNGRRRGIHVEVLPSLCSPLRTSAIYSD